MKMNAWRKATNSSRNVIATENAPASTEMPSAAAMACVVMFTHIPPQAVFQQLYQGSEFDLLQAVVFFIVAGGPGVEAEIVMRNDPQVGRFGGPEERFASADVLLCLVMGHARIEVQQRCVQAFFGGLAIAQQGGPVEVVTEQAVAVLKRGIGAGLRLRRLRQARQEQQQSHCTAVSPTSNRFTPYENRPSSRWFALCRKARVTALRPKKL